MKYYFYHGVPELVVGTELVPLNELEALEAELHRKQVSKYQGREQVMQRKIPLVDCLWNEVVQFLPFHPHKVFQLQKDLGLIPEIPNYQFFEIESSLFDPAKTVVYFKDSPGEQNSETKWLKDVDLSQIQEVPEATINYYKTLIGKGELPFNYQFVPHILYKGKIDISNCKIISILDYTQE